MLVVDERRRVTYFLDGVEAAVWDWLTLAYGYSKLVTLVAAQLTISETEAKCQVEACLHQWQEDGLLEALA